ncbi:unnamed protein product, partial [Sphacelaria rigidula]
PRQCHCFIEVSRESRMKYEWDEKTNMLKLDRVLHGAAFYPHDYGFIPQTLCGDGDPLVRIYFYLFSNIHDKGTVNSAHVVSVQQ